MGNCQTKDSVETSPPPAGNVNATSNGVKASSSAPAQSEHRPEAKKEVTQQGGAVSSQTSTAPTAGGGDSASGSHGAGASEEKLATIPLNDSLQSPHGSPLGNRPRFASYASGASTPNTSSGNLSWDGSAELDDDASRGSLGSDGEKRNGERHLEEGERERGRERERKKERREGQPFSCRQCELTRGESEGGEKMPLEIAARI